MTYPEPPKKPVFNDVMMKINEAILRKGMPFAVVVGDQPVYTLLVEIKNEHPQEYEKKYSISWSFSYSKLHDLCHL